METEGSLPCSQQPATDTTHSLTHSLTEG